jgi:hypothetical protein
VWEITNANKILVGKSEKWKHSKDQDVHVRIKVNHEEKELETIAWIHLAPFTGGELVRKSLEFIKCNFLNS